MDGEADRVTKVSIMKDITSIKTRTSKPDILKLEKLVDLMGTRYINFKILYSFMNQEAIFKKFLLGEEQYVTIEDLEQGLSQMSFPSIRGLSNKNKRGVNSLNKQL